MKPTRAVPVIVTVILLAVLSVGLLASSGCTATGPEVRQAWQAEIDRLSQATDSVSEQIGVVRQALADYQEQLATLDPDDPLVQRISGAVATANERLAILQMYESRIDGQLADAQARLDAIEDEAGGLESGLTMIGGTAQSVGAIVPGPWGPALAGIGTLIGAAGGILAKRRRDEQRDMIFAIEQGKRATPALADAFDTASATINAAMGPKVSKSVRKLRKEA